jgi:hypothetical protein
LGPKQHTIHLNFQTLQIKREELRFLRAREISCP